MRKLNFSQKLASMGVTAVSAIAVAGIAIAPAQAAVITGELAWTDGTSNFFEDVMPGAGDTFDVTFSPGSLGGLAAVFIATGEFAPPFPMIPPSPPAFFPLLPPPTATFSYVAPGGLPGTFIYELDEDLVFHFDGDSDSVVDVSVTFAAGEDFLGAFDGLGRSVGFESLSAMGASVVIDGSERLVFSEELTFGDSIGGIGGEYGGLVTTQVPEPLTILGSTMALGFGTLFKKRRSNAG